MIGLKILFDHVYPNDLNTKWVTCEKWQSYQQTSLYEKCIIMKYYRKNYDEISLHDTKYLYNEYYAYCFGDYTPLIIDINKTNISLLDYVKLLLKIYDTCKGKSRKLKGDPIRISTIRKCASLNNVSVLEIYDFGHINYPYSIIHAHTIAQFSLSTLLIRLLCHYLKQVYPNSAHELLSINKCKEAYYKKNYGEILYYNI